MSTENPQLTIRASTSRLEKGLLSIPQRFRGWFPSDKGQIEVVFDDEGTGKALTFHPYDRVVKESRIFGLAHWYLKRGVREGDVISVTLLDQDRRLYRIALDRYVREREEQKARKKLRAAPTDSEANQELTALSRLTKRRPREVAEEELLRIAQESQRRARPRVPPGAGERHEGVPSGIRILLREVHSGKCQLCSFSFEKRNGDPYFEIHHLDPEIGHHPTNLLVVCPNCHAQLEHAMLGDFRWLGNWLVSLTINGRHVGVRQPLAHDSARRVVLGLLIAVSTAQIFRRLVQ